MRNDGEIFITALLFLLGGSTGLAKAQSVAAIADTLSNMPDYEAVVEYAVTLPQAQDDIVYTVELHQPASADSYLIDWTVNSPSGRVDGFTAWFDGHFYNLRNNRLQEHHAEWDADAPDGVRAIQNSAQFASLLPSRMAMELRRLDDPELYRYTVTSSSDELRIDAVRLASGSDDAELKWVFDASTLRPLRFYADYNPGAISGQQVKAVYSPLPDSKHISGSLDEAMLRERYPLAFEQYRESQFAIESMRGRQLPGFSLPQCGAAAGRLTRRAADPLPEPTAIVMLDSDSALAPQLIEAVRNAIDRLPANVNIIWACTGKNPDEINELIGTPRPGETTLGGARTLIRDCGAATLPVILACDASGRISDLAIGLNNQTEIDVIRMFSTIFSQQ